MTEQPSPTPLTAILFRLEQDAATAEANDPNGVHGRALAAAFRHVAKWLPAALADSATGPLPILAKYGLEGMAGDPLEVLERHLTNNAAATIGGKDLLIRILQEKLDSATGPLDVERLARAMETAAGQLNRGFGPGRVPGWGVVARAIAAEYTRLASQSSGATSE